MPGAINTAATISVSAKVAKPNEVIRNAVDTGSHCGFAMRSAALSS